MQPTTSFTLVHNFGISPERIKSIGESLQLDVSEAEAGRHVGFVGGDWNFIDDEEVQNSIREPEHHKKAERTIPWDHSKPRARAWKTPLHRYTEFFQEQDTHYSAPANMTNRKDRVYTSLQPWRLL